MMRLFDSYKPVVTTRQAAFKYWLLVLACTWFALSIQAQTGGNITLSLQNVKRSEALTAVRKQVAMEFIYNVDDLNKYARISLSVKNKPLTAVLDLVLAGTGMKYEISKNVVIIRKAPVMPVVSSEPLIKVSGVVLSAAKQPLPGVAVTSTTGKGIVTDANGKYTVEVKLNDMLRFTYIGMKPAQVAIEGVGAATLVKDVQLQEEATELSQMVITGYQNLEKRNITGAVASVSVESIKIAGVNSIDRLLQGQLPGVAVTVPSGLVGVKAKVRTRGTSTLLGSQDPVWVVDGIIQSDPIPFQYTEFNALATEGAGDAIKNLIGNTVSFLNIEDIQTITVLKDASATAIYGVKAANGVIVITTKTGKPGKTAVNYNTTVTVSERPSYGMFNLMNSQQRIDVSKEIYNRGLQFQSTPDALSYEGLLKKLFDKQITQEQFEREVQRLETMNTDWFKLLYRTPVSTTHSLSVSGGSERATFYTSIGTTDQKGSSIGNDMRRYNVNLRVNANVTNRLKLGMNINGSNSTTKGFYQFDPFRYAYNTNRAIPAYNENGSPFYYVNLNSTNTNSRVTPFLFNAENERNTTGNMNRLTVGAVTGNLEYKITDDLNFQSLANYNIMYTNGESFATERSNAITGRRGYEFGTALPGSVLYNGSQLPMGGVLNQVSMTVSSYTFRNTLNYTKRLRNGKHNLTAMAGMEARSSLSKGTTVTNYGYLPDRGKSFAQLPLTTSNSGLINSNTLISSMYPAVTDRVNNYLSYFGTFTYNINQKYVFNASMRTDASNRFGQDANHRFLPVWSGGFKWNIAEEGWFNDMHWLNQFSVRSTFGFQGNVAENYGPDLIAQIPTGTSSSNGTTGEAILRIRSLAYSNLRWEKNSTANLGLDFSILQNRISGSVDYYYKKTTDAIVNYPLSYEYGVTTMPVNGGDLVNKGYELVVNFVPVRSKDWNWTVRFNTAKNFNNILQVGVNPINTWEYAASGALNKVGTPITGFWAFKYNKLDANGLPVYDNLSKDNPAKTTDATLSMEYAGQLDPKFTGGFGNTVSYRNFSLNVFFNIALGHHKFLSPLYAGMYYSAPYPAQNLPAELVHRWRQPGDELSTNIPSIPTINLPGVIVPSNSGTFSPYQLYDNSTARVVNASFVRCQNLALNYRLPDPLLKRTGIIRQCTVQASVTNLFYIASKDLQGIDPEVTGNSLPVPRNFSLSLNIGL